MHFEVPELIKKHPGATIGVIILGGLALYMLIGSGGSSTASTVGVQPGTSDADYQAALQAQTAQNATSAAASAQTQQENYGLTLDAQQSNAALTLAELNVNAGITNTNTAATLANNLNTDATQTQQLALTDQLAGLMNNNVTSQNLATITANEQTGIASINAQTQTTIASLTAGIQGLISNNQLTLGTTQANDATALGVIQSDNNTSLGVTQSNNYTSLGITQANDNASVLKTVSNNSVVSGGLGLLEAIF